jgi:hypothetical protein
MAAADATTALEDPSTLAKQEQCSPYAPNEAGGDNTSGSPAPIITTMHTEKDTLSSLEDDSSIGETP